MLFQKTPLRFDVNGYTLNPSRSTQRNKNRSQRMLRRATKRGENECSLRRFRIWGAMVTAIITNSPARALRRSLFADLAFCLSSAQRSTTISGEPCPKKSSASFAHLAAPERAVRSEPLPRCCTLYHVPDGLARVLSPATASASVAESGRAPA